LESAVSFASAEALTTYSRPEHAYDGSALLACSTLDGGETNFFPSPERPFDGKHIERVVLSEIKNKILVSRFEMSADERMSE